MPALDLIGVSRSFDRVTALADVSVSVEPGAFVALVGPSGCGKSTLLRLIAGLDRPTSGDVRIGGARRVGVGFQDPRLMPWLTVAGNIGFALGARPDLARVAAMADLLGLRDWLGAWPDQLSGGMAQRVALGRALITDPDLLLLDEPFSALDAMTRRTLQGELVRLWQASRRTVLFVTHDIEEAVLLAGRVLVLRAGRVIEDCPVPLPYPRDPTDGAVVTLRRHLLTILFGPAAATPDSALSETLS